MRAFAATGFRNALGRGGAMMAVGNIKCGQGVDGAGKRGGGRCVVDHPELMAHAVVGGYIDRGRARRRARQYRVDARRIRVSQHDRSGLRVHGLDLADPIVFLGKRRQFMLADAVLGIGGNRSDRSEAGFHMTVPGEPVDVVARLVVALQHAGRDRALQILGGLGIDRAVIGVDGRRQIDLRLGDMQETPRLARGALARFGARENVIGRRENFSRATRRRP